MSEYQKCKICGFSTNGNMNKATEATKCEVGYHDFEAFVYCAQCKSTTIKVNAAPNPMFCSVECQEKYKSNKKPAILKTCMICGKTASSFRCPSCEDELLRKQRLEQKEKHQTEVSLFDEFKNCKYGVCDIVKAHHSALIDDPERLKSEFIINLVCGTEVEEFYLERKKERVQHDDAQESITIV